MIWKVVVVHSPKQLEQQLAALDAARFGILTVTEGPMRLASRATYTIVAYSSGPEATGGTG